MELNLIKWDKLRNQIETSKDINELSELRDKIEAIRIMSKQSKQSLETQNQIAEYRIRIDRKMGEWLEENIKMGNPNQVRHDVTLKDIDINRKKSSRLQQIASIPQAEFDKHIEEVKEKGEEVTTAGLIRVAENIELKERRNRPEKIEIKKEYKIEVLFGDFRIQSKMIADNCIDMILTDPPYPREFLPLWSDLASVSARILKPSGFLVAYTGQAFLPEVYKYLSEYLEYYWTIGLHHKGGIAQRFEVNLFNRYKPIVIYQKPPRKKQDKWTEDIIYSEKKDKEKHEWGQSVEPFKKLLDIFSNTNDLILDPFAGGGAVLEACSKTNRNCIGYESNEDTYKYLKKRINDTSGNNK